MTRVDRRLAALGVMAALLLGLLLPASAGATATGSGRDPTAPLATSVSTTLGTWATVPMGNLHQPLNTFWQLLFLGTGGSTWTNRVEATATATNGGLVLGASPGLSRVVVGVRPSQELRYSPLIATDDGGRSWSNGLVFPGLADQPDSLAFSPGGRALALVGADDATEVLVDDSGLSGWHTLETQSELAGAPSGRRCGLLSIGATGFLGGAPALGGGCARHVVGVLRLDDGRWTLVGPAPPASFGSGPVAVFSMVSTSEDSMSVLFGVDHDGRLNVGAAWTEDSGRSWRVSAPLRLGRQRLESLGAAGSAGLFVLSGPSGSLHPDLHVIGGPGTPWARVVSPPEGTSTVAFPPSDAPEALAVSGTTLRVWELSADASRWSSRQLLRVPIQFGSSS
jgi:hypothetical protein